MQQFLSKRPADQVRAVVNQLVRDVNQHFVDEEAELAAAGYPLLAEHAAMHRALADKAALLIDRFQDNALDVGELFQFLAHDLIARHILSGDRDYFPYVQQARPASPARSDLADARPA